MSRGDYSIESRLLLGAVLSSLQASIQVLGAYCQLLETVKSLQH